MKSRFKLIDPGWFVAALVPLIGIIPAFSTTSIINTADGLFHTHRILAMTQLLAAGDLYPRWIPWFHLGYGYPVFNYYSPAASYLGGWLGVVGMSPALAYNLVAAGCWIVGSLGMYALGRCFLPATAAILAAALWSYAPSRLQDVWNIGNLSGFIGTALLPWLFLALARVVDQPNQRNVAWVGLAFGGVILAHQPTTVLAALVIGLGLIPWAVWVGRHNRQTILPRLLYAGGGLALGVGISLIFSLPTLLETSYIKVSLAAEDIPSVLRSGFLLPADLFLAPSAPDLGDISRRLPDTLGLLAGVLGLAGMAGLLWKRRYGLALAWGGTLAFCIFLLLEVSLDVWLSVPLLDQLRFPARVLRLAVVFTALLGGAGLLLLPRRFQAVAAGILTVVTIAAALPTIYPSRDRVDYGSITPRDEIAYEMQTYAFGGTSYNEFKPLWATDTPYDAPADVDSYLSHPMQVNYIDPGIEGVSVEQTGDRTVRVNADELFELRFRHFYFPGWTAYIDGAITEAYPTTDFGLITLRLPAGEHTVELHRENTPLQHGAALLTMLSLGAAVLLLRPRLSGSSPASRTAGSNAWLPPAAEWLPRRLCLILGGCVVGFAVLNTAYIAPQTMWFRQHSPPDAPIGMKTPVHQQFGGVYELLGYTLDQTSVAPGEKLRITLYWRALRPLDYTYQPVVQFVNQRQTEAWGVSEGFFIGANPIPHTPDYFTSDVHYISIFPDAPAYTTRITVQLIDPQTGQPLTGADGSAFVLLPDAARITGKNPPVNRVFDYRLGDSVELWCASAERGDGEIRVSLYWHVLQPLSHTGLRTFIHGLDANGSQIDQADGEPLDGSYPPADWLPGQHLIDQYTFADHPAIERIALGLYESEGERLAAMEGAIRLPDDQIILPLEKRTCQSD